MLNTTNELEKFLVEETPIIVLDSSVLLELYKYAPEVTKKLLIVLEVEDVKMNLWLPAQVLEEYENNHRTVYNIQFSSFIKIPQQIDLRIDTFKQKLWKSFFDAKRFYHPEINQLQQDVESKINEVLELKDVYLKSINEGNIERKQYQELDEPLKFINSLKENNQFGKGFNKFEKISIYNEGEFRYKLRYPPGFMDEKNKNNKNDSTDNSDIQKFGDLIIWKEILDKCKLDQRAILFVTGDMKEDWWELDNSKVVVDKHPILVEEFEFISGLSKSKFEMLPAGSFFKLMFNREKSKSYEEALERLITVYSVDSDSVVSDIIDPDKMSEELNENFNFLDFFINEGTLQERIGEIVEDVEILKIDNVEIIERSVYNPDDYLAIELLGNAICEISVEISAFDHTTLSYEYQVFIEFNLTIDIPFNEKEIESEDLSEDIKSEYDIEELLDYENMKKDYSGLEILKIREIRSPFDEMDGQACPDCGQIFPEGFSGAFCDSCAPNH